MQGAAFEKTPQHQHHKPQRFITERRHGVSNLERGAEILSRAVEYLVLEQLEGRCLSPVSSRHAIAILCDAGRVIEEQERRAPARDMLASWLQGASLTRATGKAQKR